MGYSIREASAADIPALVRHRELMFRDMGTVCDYAAMARACAGWYAHALAEGTYRGWIVESEGEAVAGAGMIVMPWSPGPSRLDPRMAWVFNVFVDPPHRRRGLARRLMEAMHAWCREQGVERLALNATAAGARVYRELGYTVVHEQMMRVDL